ncbi:MAG: AgmX/PglI C-terminal domain-containing protein [Polyangiaceae bacterium]|nr:AgmX/PglI C-terminal domain-containing protein [Polyangiaceae bacterium]
MNGTRAAGLVVGVGIAIGFLWFVLRGGPPASQTDASQVKASAHATSSSSAPRATLGPRASVEPSASAPRKRGGRERRDEMRRRIYEAFKQAPPPEAPAPKPAKAATAPAPAAPQSAKPRGTLPKGYIQKRIREDFIPLAKECYEAALERDPDLGGKLTVNFEIVGDESVGGIVESAELAEDSEIQDEEFMYCMRESMLSMTFEPPKGGGSVGVTYPFLFSNEDGDSEGPSR